MKCKRIIAALLLCTLLLACYPLTAAAVSDQYGLVVVDSVLNVRAGPGVDYARVGGLKDQTKVYIYESVTNESGSVWYRIRFDGSENAYVYSDYIQLIPNQPEESDTDFELLLQKENFPESYKPYLRALHEQYPNWVFTAQTLQMDWQTALAAQCKPKRNLVSTNYSDAWKSLHPQVYDRDSGVWKGLDGAAWVGASETAIAHYLDPRNFLNEGYIFLFLSQSYDPAYNTRAGLQQIVSGTFLDNTFPEDSTRSYADVLMSAAEQSGVSPYVLASMILVEQGRQGTGNSISGKVSGFEGLYNYLNIGAYAEGSFDPVERGLWWAAGAGTGATGYGRPWNTREKSIIGSAKYYGSNYVNVGQDTLYLKKFDLVDGGNGYYDHQYMTNIQGAASEASILKNAYADLTDAPLVFSIPVFEGLPENACPRPSGSGTVAPRLLDMDIAALPEISKLTLNDAQTVAALVARYDALEEPQKAMVTGKAALDAAQKQLGLLSGEPDQPEQPSAPVFGDTDGDGAVTVGDIIKIKGCILRSETDPDVIALCDIDGDGELTVGDIIAVKAIILQTNDAQSPAQNPD